MQGIYSITCIVTGEQYVGKAASIYRRWSEHEKLLSQGEHHNHWLAEAWAKYGPTGFAWQILEVVEDKSDLPRAEREHIARLNPAYNYQHDPLMANAGATAPQSAGTRGIAVPRLHAWRSRRLLTTYELADKADVARATVVCGERGGALSIDNIRKIAAALGISPEQLADGPPDGDDGEAQERDGDPQAKEAA